MTQTKRPPKRKAKLRVGRVIDRLSEADRLLVMAQVKEFMQYVLIKRG